MQQHPVQIVTLDDDDFKLNQESLNEIINKIPEGMKVAVVSIVGSHRTGKSFLLNLFLRYLRSTAATDRHSLDWMTEAGDKLVEGNANSKRKKGPDATNINGNSSSGSEEKPMLTGYQWGSGDQRQTTGIWMWSDPIIRPCSNTGDDIAVLVMDTQGMFDHETPVHITSQIFGLSTLVSSFQVYNVEKRIGEDNLQHLALFSEYGRMALNYKDENYNSKGGNKENISDLGNHPSFQRLQFLIRDYQNFDDSGVESFDTVNDAEKDSFMNRLESEMHSYLHSVIPENSDFVASHTHEAHDISSTRDQIRRSYKHVDCFMLPYPGLKVTKSNYDGSIGSIDAFFRIMVNRYIRKLFDDDLEPKLINNHYLGGPELRLYFQVYASMLQNKFGSAPAFSALESASFVNAENAIEKSLEFYKLNMDRYFLDGKTNKRIYLKDAELIAAHEESMLDALYIYDSMATIGTQELINKFKEELKTKIEIEKDAFIQTNNLRNPFKDLAGPQILKDKLEAAIDSTTAILGLQVDHSKNRASKPILELSKPIIEETSDEIGRYDRRDSFSDNLSTVSTPSHQDGTEDPMALISKADSLLREGKETLALQFYNKSIVAMESSSEDDSGSLLYAKVLFKEGQILGNQQRYLAAHEKLNESIKIQKKLLGLRHLDVAAALCGLAIVHFLEGQYKATLKILEEVLQIREPALGGEHPLVRDTLHNISIVYEKIASVYEGCSEHEQALSSLKSALCIVEGLSDHESYDVAVILSKMATIYMASSHLQDALDTYQECLRIRVSLMENRVCAWDEFADVQVLENEISLDRIIDMLHDCAAMKSALLGPNHIYVAFIFSNIARLYELHLDYEKSLEYYSKCLFIEKAAFGNEHLSVAETYCDMAVVQNKNGNLASALQYMNESISVKSSVLGRHHEDVVYLTQLKLHIINSTRKIANQLVTDRMSSSETSLKRNKLIYVNVDNSEVLWTQQKIRACEQMIQSHNGTEKEENCVIS